MTNEDQLFLLSALDSLKTSRNNLIIVCLHKTAAVNMQAKFMEFARSAQLPRDVIGPGVVEVRVEGQWRRVYFASGYQHPDHYAGRVARVLLMPGVQDAMHSWAWQRMAESQSVRVG